MNKDDLIKDYWLVFNNQRWNELVNYFTTDANIIWPHTKETFTVKQFIEINSNYPGNWLISLKEKLNLNDSMITVVEVSDEIKSYHAVSFFKFKDDKITELKEYWGENVNIPDWRK